MGIGFGSLVSGWLKLKSMHEHQPYDPQVYKRLELIRKQFKREAAAQKTRQSASSRRVLLDWLTHSKQGIVRWAVYVFLTILLLAVIMVTIAELLKN